MKLFDTYPGSDAETNIGVFDGGMSELRYPEITKSFKKAKSMVLERLTKKLVALQKEIEYIKTLEEEDCPEIDSFYQ